MNQKFLLSLLFFLSVDGACVPSFFSYFTRRVTPWSWFDLVSNGDLEGVDEFIDSGINVNLRNREGHSALDLAIRGRKFNVLDRLLADERVIIPADCAHVNIRNRILVEKLIKVPRFNVNYVNEHGDSVLHQAIHNRYLHIVKMLIEDPRVNVNIPNSHQDTPLHQIIKNTYFNEEIVIQLINRPDTKVYVTNIFGFTPLYLAILNNRTQTARELLKDPSKIDLNQEESVGHSALNLAAKKELLEIVQLLIKANPDLSFKDIYGKTALDYAQQFNNEAIIAELEDALSK